MRGDFLIRRDRIHTRAWAGAAWRRASATSYARLTPGLLNTPEEVDAALRVRELG